MKYIGSIRYEKGVILRDENETVTWIREVEKVAAKVLGYLIYEYEVLPRGEDKVDERDIERFLEKHLMDAVDSAFIDFLVEKGVDMVMAYWRGQWRRVSQTRELIRILDLDRIFELAKKELKYLMRTER
jgi:hypothetical protein